MTGRARRWQREAGAALITVLTMVAVMAMLAAAIVEASRFSLRRLSNLDAMQQARWYLLGAEEAAIVRIVRLRQVAGDRPVDTTGVLGRPFTYPIDGGTLEVTVFDGSNCFNLNALGVQSEDGGVVASATGQVQFARLLDAVDAPVVSGAGLAAALADWIDADQTPGAGGAEREDYRRARLAHTPSDLLLADFSELARVRGFDAEILRRLEGLACVRATTAPNRLNVNTLRPDQAPLLVALIGPSLSLASAQAVIRERPVGGWAGVEAFFAHPRLSGLEVSDATRADFAVASQHYVIRARVQRAGLSETSAALIEAGPRVRVLRRVFGVGMEGWPL